MSNNLCFDDGSQKLLVNSDPERVITWYPNDVNFVDRFMAFQKYVETLQGKIGAIKGLDSAELDENGTPSGDEYVQGSFEALGAEFNAELDKAFGVSVSKAAFGLVNPISPTPSGGFVYENFLTALTPKIEESFKGFEQSRQKYTDGLRNRAGRRSHK